MPLILARGRKLDPADIAIVAFNVICPSSSPGDGNLRSSYVSFGLLYAPLPRKGTETNVLRTNSLLTTFGLYAPLPRKGTETLHSPLE